MNPLIRRNVFFFFSATFLYWVSVEMDLLEGFSYKIKFKKVLLVQGAQSLSQLDLIQNLDQFPAALPMQSHHAAECQ